MPDKLDRGYDIAQQLEQISRAIRYAADCLGTNAASTPLGAIEVLAMEVREGFTRLSDSIDGLATAIEVTFDRETP